MEVRVIGDAAHCGAEGHGTGEELRYAQRCGAQSAIHDPLKAF